MPNPPWRWKPIALFGCLYVLGLGAMLWLAADELPFLHPGKVHVYVDLDEDVSEAFVGKHELNTSGVLDTLWVEPGTHDVRFEIRGSVHARTVNIQGETYISLDGEPPYVHGFD